MPTLKEPEMSTIREYMAFVEARPDAKLTVYVPPGAPRYWPGDEVRVDAQALEFAGKPVANADV